MSISEFSGKMARLLAVLYFMPASLVLKITSRVEPWFKFYLSCLDDVISTSVAALYYFIIKERGTYDSPSFPAAERTLKGLSSPGFISLSLYCSVAASTMSKFIILFSIRMINSIAYSIRLTLPNYRYLSLSLSRT